jgi:hypothetical protein
MTCCLKLAVVRGGAPGVPDDMICRMARRPTEASVRKPGRANPCKPSSGASRAPITIVDKVGRPRTYEGRS